MYSFLVNFSSIMFMQFSAPNLDLEMLEWVDVGEVRWVDV